MLLQQELTPCKAAELEKHSMAQQHATSLVFTSRLKQHWKATLEQKFVAIPRITEMCDILVSKKAGKVDVDYRRMCFDSEYITLHNYNYNSEQPLPCLSLNKPVLLFVENLRQLSKQHRRYIKQDVPDCFLSRPMTQLWIHQVIQRHGRKRPGTVPTLPVIDLDTWTQLFLSADLSPGSQEAL